MKHKRTIRFFALILSTIMCISLMPVMAYADFSIELNPTPAKSDTVISFQISDFPEGTAEYYCSLKIPKQLYPCSFPDLPVGGPTLSIAVPTGLYPSGLDFGMYRLALSAFSATGDRLGMTDELTFCINSPNSINDVAGNWSLVSYTKGGVLNSVDNVSLFADSMTMTFGSTMTNGYYTCYGTNLIAATVDPLETLCFNPTSSDPAYYTVLDGNKVLIELGNFSGNRSYEATLATDTDGVTMTIPLLVEGDNIVFRRSASTPTPPPAPVYDYDPIERVIVPVFGDENRVKVHAELDGSTATIEDIKDNVINQVIGDDVETGIVHIDLSDLNRTVKKAILKKTTLDKIADAIKDSNNDATGLEIDLTTAKVRFDAAATLEVQNQAKGSTLWLVVDNVRKTALNKVQKETVETLNVAKIIDAYLVSDGLRLCTEESEGLGYGKARVMLPYKLKKGETPAIYTVYYLDDEGVLQELDAVYNIDENCFEFDLEHFSNYVIAYTTDKAESFNYMKCPQDTTCVIDPYWDSDPLAWYHDGVHYCIENGLMIGYPDRSFRPLNGITRAEIAMTLWRIEGCPAVNDAPEMADVLQDAWYADAVRWATAKNVMEVAEDGLFHSEDAASREELANILYAYAKTKGRSTNSNDGVSWCTDNKIVLGTENGLLELDRIIYRAEAAAMFQRTRELLVFGR